LEVPLSLSITINVLQLSSAVYSGNGNNLKFRVCHRPSGNPINVQKIVVSVNALNAHLVSGSNGHNNCYLGTCSYNCVSSTSPNGQTQYNGRGVNGTPDFKNQTSEKFTLNVSPNPTNSEFMIQVFIKSIEPVTVRVFDNNGALRSVSSSTSGTNYVLVGRDLPNGIYMAEVIQGANRKTVKLLKMKLIRLNKSVFSKEVV
jgi:hypothetical protein